ncbi:uncharacterized protein BO96DRAFT_416855 [Aspergillus niger CBS 101883]|uniref:uncharacterized protein n=1 Tax=Aspergillus lacticoffeatus (strain CBS 101883) TaxID=1450533 RepID=UPI000D7F11C1|nr:uncharacterized protein BO96DRAFT_416855 [Aspergillus niger CBS 101883]PYH50744.1 hypothetical protein BO96DRAFT_416855 [Aspergillus niger CBS 101883]
MNQRHYLHITSNTTICLQQPLQPLHPLIPPTLHPFHNHLLPHLHHPQSQPNPLHRHHLITPHLLPRTTHLHLPQPLQLRNPRAQLHPRQPFPRCRRSPRPNHLSWLKPHTPHMVTCVIGHPA